MKTEWKDKLMLFKNKGKTVVGFTTHGCMAQIHEFDWLGIIDGISYPVRGSDTMFYKIKILKDRRGELRDDESSLRYEEVSKNDIQDLGGTLVHYQ